MIAKIAFLGALAHAQTETVVTTVVPSSVASSGSTDVASSTGSPGTSAVAGTGSVDVTTTGVPSTITGVAEFDPAKHWLSVNIGNCAISDFSNKDIFNLLDGVNQKLISVCGVSATIADVTDGEGVCAMNLKTELVTDYKTLIDCFYNPMDYSLMGITYPVTLPEDVKKPIDPSAFTYGDFRDKFEAGLDATLKDDDSVIRIKIDQQYDEIYSNFDSVVDFLNDLVVKIGTILSPDGSQSVDIVGIFKDESDGKTEIVVRPVSEDEASSLQKLKDLSNDPSSALNNLDGVETSVSTTTNAPTGSTTSSEDGETSTTSTEHEDEGADWPLIGGLVGGIAGAAAIGGGAFFVAKKKKGKKSEGDSWGKNTLVPNDSTAGQVYTPNTKHGVEGVLTDRTPRATSPNTATFD